MLTRTISVAERKVKVHVLPHFIPMAMVFRKRDMFGGNCDTFVITSSLAAKNKRTVEAALAHELGHIDLRHLDEQIDKQMKYVENCIEIGMVFRENIENKNFLQGLKKFVISLAREIKKHPYQRNLMKECAADAYAVELGYGPELCALLTKMSRKPWFYGLKGTRELKIRIQRLYHLMDTLLDDTLAAVA